MSFTTTATLGFALACALAGACAKQVAAPESERRSAARSEIAKPRPNILLIVADDLGYSDIGAFGGEIRTPNLDQLAAEGRLLTDHHAAAACSPTRAMLMSGTDHHLVGLGSMAELLRPEQRGKPGYEGYLNQRALSVAQLLRDGGYHTYIAGKWHLGTTAAQSPHAWGFEASFVLVQGAASHFAPVHGERTGADTGLYRENGAEVSLPRGYFSTDAFTDKLLAFLAQHRDDGRPFFAFAAYTAPHWPLQAPDEDLARYSGRYDAGYAAIRAARVARQKELGIVPIDFQPSRELPNTPANPTWNALSAQQRKLEARRMEIYAAMVDNLDRNIGRLIDELKHSGQYERTFVFFQSDNGAEAGRSGFEDNEHNDNRYENLGRPRSNVAYGKRWAEVSATPFRLWKGSSTEGGVVVPAIAHLPGQRTRRAHLASLSHVSDLVPTFLALASLPDPGSRYRERDVHPITGISLLPALAQERTQRRERTLADELFGRRYVRRGPWKLTWLEPPLGNGRWALFDLTSDRAESTDLAAQQPEIVRALAAEWDAYAERVGVVLPHVPGF